MRRCAFGVWWTKDVQQLFEYALSTRESDRPLRIVGFDVQFTPGAHRSLPGILRDWLQPYSGALADRAFAADSAFLSDFAPKNSTVFDSVAAVLDGQAPAIARASSRSEVDIHLLAISLRSIAAFQRIGRADTVKAMVWQRDRGMASNIRDLLALYPESKFIIWGHNFHLRERNSDVKPYFNPTMGEWLDYELGSDLYTIGFYMGEGTATNNDRSIYAIASPEAGFLEHRMAVATESALVRAGVSSGGKVGASALADSFLGEDDQLAGAGRTVRWTGFRPKRLTADLCGYAIVWRLFCLPPGSTRRPAV